MSSQSNTLPIAPGIEGFGRLAVAGSGRHLVHPCSQIFVVKNLNDKGPNSLRECVEARGPRTCVFEVAGVIWATKALRIVNPYLTIAGQTAPFPGITLRGSGISTETSEVFIQHLKVRPGDDPRAACCKLGTCDSVAAQFCTQDPGSRDGINTHASSGAIKNIVYDHLSISWALDEGFSLAPAAGPISNVTLSNSLITNGLDMSIHPEASDVNDPGHSKGVLINGVHEVQNLSFIKTLLAHNAERNIRIASPVSMEYVNNIIYNWGRGRGSGRLIEGTNSVLATHKFDLIGNQYIPGLDSFCPETQYRPELCAAAPNGIDTPEQRAKMTYMLRVGSGVGSGLSALSRYYLHDNRTHTRVNPAEEWQVVDRAFFISSSSSSLIYPQNKADTPQSSSRSVAILDSASAYTYVLENSGAFPSERDSIDTKVLQEVRNGSGRIINCVASDGSQRCLKNGGGWPNFALTTRLLVLPVNPNADDDGDGYTNLENWIMQF